MRLPARPAAGAAHRRGRRARHRTDVDGAEGAGSEHAAERDVADTGAARGGEVAHAHPAAAAAAAAVPQGHREHARLERFPVAAVQQQAPAPGRLVQRAVRRGLAACLDALGLQGRGTGFGVPGRDKEAAGTAPAMLDGAWLCRFVRGCRGDGQRPEVAPCAACMQRGRGGACCGAASSAQSAPRKVCGSECAE